MNKQQAQMSIMGDEQTNIHTYIRVQRMQRGLPHSQCNPIYNYIK